jgi:hypothetical protein
MRFIITIIISLFLSKSIAQKNTTYRHVLNAQGYPINIYAYEMNSDIKVKYFPQNANMYFDSWREGKYVLMACSGAFSENWHSNSLPVGFTAHKGRMINRNIDSEMDGLVIIQDFNIEIGDLDEFEAGITTDDGAKIQIYPRSNSFHRALLSEVINELNLTVFQTQLIYYYTKNNNFSNVLYGKKAKRRFLATCYKNDNYYSVIIDIPVDIHLNLGGKYAKDALSSLGYYCSAMVNLDTGSKNIFLLGKGDYLKDQTTFKISDATNLIVFYTE